MGTHGIPTPPHVLLNPLPLSKLLVILASTKMVPFPQLPVQSAQEDSPQEVPQTQSGTHPKLPLPSPLSPTGTGLTSGLVPFPTSDSEWPSLVNSLTSVLATTSVKAPMPVRSTASLPSNNLWPFSVHGFSMPTGLILKNNLGGILVMELSLLPLLPTGSLNNHLALPLRNSWKKLVSSLPVKLSSRILSVGLLSDGSLLPLPNGLPFSALKELH